MIEKLNIMKIIYLYVKIIVHLQNMIKIQKNLYVCVKLSQKYILFQK